MDIRSVIHDLNSTDFAKFLNICAPVECIQVYNSIRAETWQDAPLPGRSADGLMMSKCVCSRVCGAQHFDVETIKEGARSKFGPGQFLSEALVKPVRVGGGRFFVDAKDIPQ